MPINERVIFDAAVEIPDPEARLAFVEKACEGDAELQARVLSLLKSHTDAGSFLEIPAAAPLGKGVAEITEKTIVGVSMGNDEDDSDDDSNRVDLSFLQPSTKAGSIGTLGHYEILKVLGQGGFGVVFKAFDEKLHRHVAIKVMNPQMAATSPPRKRFLREARSAAAIRHENIVAVHSVEEQPLPYLVMEFIDGQTLQQKLDGSGPLDVTEILYLGQQIASGLAAAHALSLIHRDIKPGNILIEGDVEQKVKITDFGLARAADDASLTRSGMISGTPMYMAPEQATGQALDHRTDLFSLGSVLYQMACGRPPFRAPNTVAVLRRVAEDTPRALQEIAPELPDWLVVIINKLLAKKPEDRFQSAKEVAELLGRCRTELQLSGRVTCVTLDRAGSVSAQSTSNEPRATKDSEGSRPAPAGGTKGNVTHEKGHPPVKQKLTAKRVAVSLLLGLLMMSPILFGKHVSRLTSSWFFGSIRTLPVVERAAGLRFDGEDDFVQVPVNWDLPQFTIEAFVTPAEAGPHRTLVELSNYGSGAKEERLELYDALGGKGERLSFAAVVGRSGSLNAFGPQTAGVREHRAIVCDGQEIHYYINGVWQGKRKNQPQDNQLWRMRWLTIGCQLGEKNFFKGEIDQLRISKVARYTGNFPAVSMVENDDATLALYNFEEGTGDVVKDMSGNGLDARISGATWIHQARGLQFDGVDDHVEFSGLSWNSNQYTIEAYISQGGEHGNIFQAEGSGGMLHMYLYRKGGGAGINRDQVYANANGPRPTKIRQHLAVVYDGKNLNFFVEGKLAGVKANVSAAATPMPLDRMRIGSKLQSDPSKPEFFEGRLEQLRVSDNVRYVLPFQPGELKTDDETLALYDFTTGQGDIVKDASGRSPDGKVVGATWATPANTSEADRLRILGNKILTTSLGTRIWWEKYRSEKMNVTEIESFQHQVDGTMKLVSVPAVRMKTRQGETIAVWALNLADGTLHDSPVLTEFNAAGEPETTFYIPLAPNEREGILLYDGVGKDGHHLFRSTGKPLHVRAMKTSLNGKVFEFENSRELEESELVDYLNLLSEIPTSHPLEVADADTSLINGWHGWPADAPKPAIAPFDADLAKQLQIVWAKHLNIPTEFTDSRGMKFVLIPPGEFQMGYSQSELDELMRELKQAGAGEFDLFAAGTSGPQHPVRITQPYYMSAHEVSVAQYRRFLEETKYVPSADQLGGKIKWTDLIPKENPDPHPAVGVSWTDADNFCTLRSQKAGVAYRLPTEAEWEYACRAGTTTLWSFGDRPEPLGEYSVTTIAGQTQIQPVGSHKPNPFGLFDLYGNAEEWCRDWHTQDYYAKSPVDDPVNLASPADQNSGRVCRGGGVGSLLWQTRSSSRRWDYPSSPVVPRGFRVVITGDLKKAAATVGSSSRAPVASQFPPLAPEWIERVSKLPRLEQEIEVGAELQRRNPEWDGRFKGSSLPNGQVAWEMDGSHIVDITPVSVFKRLGYLGIPAKNQKGGLKDLSPLAELKELARIDVPHHIELSDLTPLANLPITYAELQNTAVVDLSPLKGKDLSYLHLCGCRKLQDISPVQHATFNQVFCIHQTEIRDITPLKDSPLQNIALLGDQYNPDIATSWKSLKSIAFPGGTWRDVPRTALLRLNEIQTLERINGQPVSEFWNQYDEEFPPSLLDKAFGPDSTWSAPVNLGTSINTAARESNPSLTSDELLLVFARDGVFYEARRESRDQPFGAAVKLRGPFTNPKPLSSGCLSRDGLQLVFSSSSLGEESQDVLLSTRSTRDEPFGEPLRLPPPINSPLEDRHPALSPDGLTLALTTDRPDQRRGTAFLFTRTAPDAEFNPTPIVDPNLQADWNVVTSFSGDVRVLIKTTMADNVETHTWHSRIGDTNTWSPGQPFPAPLKDLKFGAPFLSSDGTALYFHTRSLPDGQGDLDLWMSRRVKKASP